MAVFSLNSKSSIASINKTTRYLIMCVYNHSFNYNQIQTRRRNSYSYSYSTTTQLNETQVLNELSHLLDFQIPLNNTKPSIPKLPLDHLLLPEDKLRGVFLQKLKGKSAIHSALSNVSVDLTLDVVSNVVNRGNLGGDAILTFFDWAIKENPKVLNNVDAFNVVVKALGRRKFFEFMEQLVSRMSPNLETFSIVVASFVRARRVNKAIDVFKGFGYDTESLNVVLRCLCKRGHVGAACKLLGKMRGKIEFNGVSYNVVLGGLARFGKVVEMERFLSDMVKDGICPDCSTYACLVEGLGRAGRVEDAVKVFDSMGKRGCVPDVGVYNAMICNFVSVGNFDECRRFYEDMLNSGCAPNEGTYVKLVGAFIKARKVADALEIFEEMLSRGVVLSTGTVTSFIEPLCSNGPPYAAMMIYRNARKAGCVISLSAYKLLFMRLAQFGKCGMMLKLWDEMQECGNPCDVEVYEYVIDGLCNNGQLENAVLVMEECLRRGFCPSKPVYSRLNNKLLASDRVERAYKLFLKVKSARKNENARKYWRSRGWHF